MASLLLVTSERELAQSLRMLVEPQHTVAYAENAQEVFARIAAKERFDVIFSDVDLPDMSGVTMKLRLSRICPEMSNRVVFLTGTSGWGSAELDGPV